MDLGGRDVTDYLVKLMAEKGHKFTSITDRDVVRNIKEKKCYVALDVDTEKSHQSNTESAMELPDGNSIELHQELYKVPEIMFDPKLIGSEQCDLPTLVLNSIMKTQIDLRRVFWSNIVLCGGNTLFKGMRGRLMEELREIAPESVRIKIDAGASVKDRKYCVWTGAAIISEIATFREGWVTRNQYIDEGASRISAKGRYCAM